MARDSPKNVSAKKSEILQAKEDFVRVEFFRGNCGDAMVGFFLFVYVYFLHHTLLLVIRHILLLLARVLTISLLHLTGHWSYTVNIIKYGFVEQNRCFLLRFSFLPLYLCKA